MLIVISLVIAFYINFTVISESCIIPKHELEQYMLPGERIGVKRVAITRVLHAYDYKSSEPVRIIENNSVQITDYG